METIDFGCQVRCLNRQRLIPGSTHPQLNQCASQFLAKVRKEVMTSDSPANSSKLPEVGWMKLKLSERGLRILPPPTCSISSSSSSSCASSTTSSTSGMRNLSLQQKSRKSDEGFESDSDTSIQPHNNSGGSSSGVNSSSSDIDEADEVIRNNSKKINVNGDSSDSDCSAERMNVLLTVPIRCTLSDILSCQHPPALGRHVVLLTLRSADDSALDILALECSAEEPARILTMLCQKIQASGTGGGPVNSGANNPASSGAPPTCAVTSAGDPGPPSGKKSGPQASAVGSNGPVAAKTAAVSIQSWSDRDRDKRTLDAILVDSKHSSASDIGVGVKAQNIIRKLERQHSEWSLIQRRTHDGLTHLQISKQQKSSSTFLNHTGDVGGGGVGGGGIRGQSNASVQTATSGGMLNNSSSSNSKKGMPYGGQLARLETALAITNSHQGQASRSSGVGGVAAGLKRSETTTAMHQKLSKSKSSSSSVASGSSPSPPSCILSLQTPELPMGPSVTGLSPAEVSDASTSTSQSQTPPLPQSHPPAKTSRWSFGAPFRQQPQPQRLHSPEASRRNTKSNQRGRSSERKSSKFDALSTSSAPQTNKSSSSSSELNGLFVSSSGMLSIKSNNNNNNNNNSKKNSKSSKSLPEILPVQSPVVAPKIKRDPSKTRSFLMKLTSSSRKSPTPPTPPPPSSTLSLDNQTRSGVDPEFHRSQHPLKLQSRGRSLIRLRSSTRLQSPPPPGPHSGGQTFLIPTKSGQELTRNIYPKEGPVTQQSSSQQQQQQQQALHQPVFHLLTGHNNKNASGRLRYSNGPPPVANGWAGYCWNEAAAAAALVRHPVPQYATSMDTNNNQHLHQQQQQQQQQQQWIYFHPHPVHHPAPPPQPPPTLIKAGDFNKLRLQRSRSQSPGRMRSSQRWLPPPPPPPPAGPPSIGHYYALPSPIHQQPVSLPPDMSHMLSQQQQRSSAQTSPSTSTSSSQDLLSAAARSFRRSKSTHTRMSSRSHLAPSKSSGQNSNNNNSSNGNKAVTFHAFATVQLVD